MIRAWLRYSLVLVALSSMTGCAGAPKPGSASPPSQGGGGNNPPPPPPPTASFSVSPTSIQTGQSATLSWTTTHATSVQIDGIGTVQPNGSESVSPSASTTYDLTAQGAGGTLDVTTQLTVTPPPSPTMVNHIILLAEENRGFDHYFGKLNDYRSAAPFNLSREVNGLPDDCSSANSDFSESRG